MAKPRQSPKVLQRRRQLRQPPPPQLRSQLLFRQPHRPLRHQGQQLPGSFRRRPGRAVAQSPEPMRGRVQRGERPQRGGEVVQRHVPPSPNEGLPLQRRDGARQRLHLRMSTSAKHKHRTDTGVLWDLDVPDPPAGHTVPRHCTLNTQAVAAPNTPAPQQRARSGDPSSAGCSCSTVTPCHERHATTTTTTTTTSRGGPTSWSTGGTWTHLLLLPQPLGVARVLQQRRALAPRRADSPQARGLLLLRAVRRQVGKPPCQRRQQRQRQLPLRLGERGQRRRPLPALLLRGALQHVRQAREAARREVGVEDGGVAQHGQRHLLQAGGPLERGLQLQDVGGLHHQRLGERVAAPRAVLRAGGGGVPAVGRPGAALQEQPVEHMPTRASRECCAILLLRAGLSPRPSCAPHRAVAGGRHRARATGRGARHECECSIARAAGPRSSCVAPRGGAAQRSCATLRLPSSPASRAFTSASTQSGCAPCRRS